MEIFSVIVSLLFASVAVSRGQECSVDRLPPFGDARDLDNFGRPDRDRFQAIMPAYTFQCSGRVTEWRACVEPSGRGDRYYIQFQVWRPITGSTDGCYRLVDYNIPEDITEITETEEDRSESDAGGALLSPLDGCVVLPVRVEEQIEFQSGDVVGYYVDRDGDDRADDNAGIQWIEDNDVVVYYRDQLPREDIQSYYAIGGPNPTDCGFTISGASSLYTLTDSASAAPIISLSISIVMMTSSPLTSSPLSSSPTPLPPPVMVISTNVPSLTPSPSTIPNSTPSPSCISSRVSDELCGEHKLNMANDTLVADGNSAYYVNIAAGISISLLALIIATVVVILVLLCLRRRKVKSEPVDNVAYNCHECEIKTDTNAAYYTVNNDVITATNAAYAATSVPSTSGENDVDIAISPNEAYISTDIATSVDVAYEPVQSSSDNATYGTVDVTTLEYDYPRQEN